MLHHFSIPVSDLARSIRFYDATLSPLGYPRRWTHQTEDGFQEAAAGYGMAGIEDGFAIRHREGKIIIPGDGFHLAFTAPSQDAVVAFYQAALQFGGRDNGPAGLHPEHGANYFAAFVYDPDGYRIEAVLPPHS